MVAHSGYKSDYTLTVHTKAWLLVFPNTAGIVAVADTVAVDGGGAVVAVAGRPGTAAGHALAVSATEELPFGRPASLKPASCGCSQLPACVLPL